MREKRKDYSIRLPKSLPWSSLYSSIYLLSLTSLSHYYFLCITSLSFCLSHYPIVYRIICISISLPMSHSLLSLYFSLYSICLSIYTFSLSKFQYLFPFLPIHFSKLSIHLSSFLPYPMVYLFLLTDLSSHHPLLIYLSSSLPTYPSPVSPPICLFVYLTFSTPSVQLCT